MTIKYVNKKKYDKEFEMMRNYQRISLLGLTLSMPLNAKIAL